METTISNDNFPGKVRLILPKTIYATSCVEANVCFDNAVLVINPANYVFHVVCQKGVQQTERWTYIPETGDIGDYPFAIEVRDDQNNLMARSRSTLRIVPADAGSGRSMTLLCIGDSLTYHSGYTGNLLNLCNQLHNFCLHLIGTHHPCQTTSEENRHEGYDGWTAERFVSYYNENARKGDYIQRGSLFLYPDPNGEPKLDFLRYLYETNDGNVPDTVTIFLGCNDIFDATDETIECDLSNVFIFYDGIVDMVRSSDKRTKIGLILIPPPAASQDAFGANYGCGQTRW